MTLAISLVTPYGVWASVDHRLTAIPTGDVVTDASVKHVVIRCPDGAALISYTGFGRVGRIDVSQWIREVLRGESRTVDDSLIDLREQASLSFGVAACRAGVSHSFLGGAFIGGVAWAIEIRNLRPASGLLPATLQPEFETAAIRAEGPLLLAAGAGRDAISEQDQELLKRVSMRRPRRPSDFMRLLGEVNMRAAESRHPGARTISKSCTVVYLPPSGDGVEQQWYGPEGERNIAPQGFSHVLFGIDLNEMASRMLHGRVEDRASQEELQEAIEKSGHASVQPRGRKGLGA